MEREFAQINREVGEEIGALRRQIEKEFPFVSRITRSMLGPILLWSSRREEKRLAAGQTYEPPTILQRTNWASA
jgi:hypothetical protein